MFLLFLFGLAIGSFLNVLIFRYDPEKKFTLRTAGGRSRCLHCGRTLRWFELVPVLSFLFQSGKCRRCGKRISLQYPVVELASAALFVYVPVLIKSFLFQVSFMPAPWIIAGLSALWTVVFLSLLAVFFIDIRHFVIPNYLNSFIFFLGVVWTAIGQILSFGGSLSKGSFLGSYADLFYFSGSFLINHLLGSVLAAGFFLLIVFLSKGRGMGVGDVKLMAGLGLLFGYPDILMVMALSFIFGTLYSIPLLLARVKRMSDRIPFGPFIVVAAFVVFFFGLDVFKGYFAIIESIGGGL